MLKAIWTLELDPLFWRSNRVGVDSAWYGHVPFAHWIVQASKPRSIVELGSHNGVSYAAFCQAAQQAGLGVRCFAVDTWKGDEHAGFYGEDVYAAFRAYHDERFSAFSTLIRRTFDDALEMVPDNSVDLLHIDGRHAYEDVRHDYESWQSKMSNRGVILFHDTNVRDGGFGVWRLWSELQGEFPRFEFLHAYGLGVLAVGSECPPPIMALTGLRDVSAIGAVRERFAQLGERCVLDAQVRLLGKQNHEHVQQIQVNLVQLRSVEAELATTRIDLQDISSALAETNASLASLQLKAVQAREAAAAELGALRLASESEVTQARQVAAAELDAARSDSEKARLVLAGAEAKLVELQTTIARLQSDVQIAGQTVLAAEQTQNRVKEACSRADAAAAQAGRDRSDALAREATERARANTAQAAEQAARAEATAAHGALHAEATHRAAAEAARDRILLSGTWRATRPLRTGLSRLPTGLRTPTRGALQAAWRVLTPHLNDQRRPLPAQAAPPKPPALPAPAAVPSDSVPAAAAALRVCYVSGEPDTPGTIYRVHRYAAACTAAGASVSVLRVDEVGVQLAEAGMANIVVIWRAVWTDALAAFVAAARNRGARIVFDVDDLMIDPALGTIAVIDGIRSQNVTETAVQAHYALVQRTMFAADYCCASTRELSGHMRRFGKTSFTLPNGFDAETLHISRMAARRRMAAPGDGLLRLGYASGSRTHQRDFAEVAAVLPNVLRAYPQCRLVLFQASAEVKLVDIEEFPALEPFLDRIEWRDLVPLHRLPEEIARFDVNLAPLQPDNPFCEAKSELKYFEGALAGVCTVASPVGPYARAIHDGSNGFIAATAAQWEAALTRLLGDPALRCRIAQTALNDVLWTYGPDRRAQLMRRVLAEWQGGPAAADAFVLELGQAQPKRRPAMAIPAGQVVFNVDSLRRSEVTVAIPLHDYAHTILKTLESVRAQSLAELDLVIIDDASTDRSLEVALGWTRAYAGRFNRVSVIRNHANAGLGSTRNAAFSAAETPYVLPLDADNLLRPRCCQELLAAMQRSGCAFAYPVIQEFGGRTGLMGTDPYHPSRFVGGNYIDAMALIARSAWSAAGGYASMRQGWEDYDFWCAVAEVGLGGYAMGGEPLADYRVHAASMLAQVTDGRDVKNRVIDAIERRHSWVTVSRPLEAKPLKVVAEPEPPPAAPGLHRLMPILRCPETGGRLELVDGRLRTQDGSRSWSLKAGRPILFPGMRLEAVAEFSHLSNELPPSALALIRSAKGLVLNLSAGGTAERFDHVVEAEAAIFGHTDLVADSHHLPFADQSFEVVIAMNAFEHYRDPPRAAAEIHRVLQPGGRVLIRTAFLQPQHEPPHHYCNATRFGVAEWFSAFETEQLHVSDNFNPSYAFAWMAHDCHQALLRDVGPDAAAGFAAEPAGRFAQFWTDPASRAHRAWRDFAKLSQLSQEAIAAGFEYLGRRPL